MRNFIADQVDNIANLFSKAVIVYDREYPTRNPQYAAQTDAFDEWNYKQESFALNLWGIAHRIRYSL